MEVSGTVSYKGCAVIHTVTDNLLVSDPDPVGSEYGFAVEGAVVDTDQIVKAKPLFQNEFSFVNGIPWNYTDVAEISGAWWKFRTLSKHSAGTSDSAKSGVSESSPVSLSKQTAQPFTMSASACSAMDRYFW